MSGFHRFSGRLRLRVQPAGEDRVDYDEVTRARGVPRHREGRTSLFRLIFIADQDILERLLDLGASYSYNVNESLERHTFLYGQRLVFSFVYSSKTDHFI